ncbi:MAG: hypothetical protein WC438_00055 [Candidatus Pacearchaeota archaeon]
MANNEAEKAIETIIKKAEKEKAYIKKHWIILSSVILVILILGIIYLFAQPAKQASFKPLDVTINNKTAFSSTILYEKASLLALTGWESKITYNNKEDRIFGKEDYKKVIFDEKGNAYTYISLDNEIKIEPLTTNPNTVTKVGWFTKPEQITIKEDKSWLEKTEVVTLTSDSDVTNAVYTYNFYKNKPYFKVQFSADAENPEKLGKFAYGLVLKDYDIYLPNRTILLNDNKITDLNTPIELAIYQDDKRFINVSDKLQEEISQDTNTEKNAVKRTGSIYKTESEYEIFYNPNTQNTIIIYSPNVDYFENSFLWQVFRVYTSGENGQYPPLYFIVIPNSDLTYNEQAQDWTIVAKESINAKDYINKMINEIK